MHYIINFLLMFTASFLATIVATIILRKNFKKFAPFIEPSEYERRAMDGYGVFSNDFTNDISQSQQNGANMLYGQNSSSQPTHQTDFDVDEFLDGESYEAYNEEDMGQSLNELL